MRERRTILHTAVMLLWPCRRRPSPVAVSSAIAATLRSPHPQQALDLRLAPPPPPAGASQFGASLFHFYPTSRGGQAQPEGQDMVVDVHVGSAVLKRGAYTHTQTHLVAQGSQLVRLGVAQHHLSRLS